MALRNLKKEPNCWLSPNTTSYGVLKSMNLNESSRFKILCVSFLFLFFFFFTFIQPQSHVIQVYTLSCWLTKPVVKMHFSFSAATVCTADLWSHLSSLCEAALTEPSAKSLCVQKSHKKDKFKSKVKSFVNEVYAGNRGEPNSMESWKLKFNNSANIYT